jgi:putative transposase
MARVARSSLPDGYYHVVARGIPEQKIFVGDGDRAAFVQLFERVHAKHGWACHAYCLMATHYHLVLTATREALSAGLCELNGLYARGFNQRHGRFGHLFAGRFTARAIESEEYLYDACSYVVLNPVKARLCERVEEWPWSYSCFGLES